MQASLSERVVVDWDGCNTALHFGVKAEEKTYKAKFIANSSFCTTTEHSKLLTSCLTAVKTRY